MENKTWSELLAEADAVTYTPAPTRRANKRVEAKPAIHVYELGFGTFDYHATQFIETITSKLRYSAQVANWYYWDTHVWRVDDEGRASEQVKAFGRSFLYKEAETDEARKANKHWYTFFTSPKGVRETLSHIKTDPLVKTHIKDFDSNVYDLNTPEGVVDLYTGKVNKPNPKSLVRRSTAVAPDSKCPTPKYERLLSETFAGDKELSDYFETMVGLSMIKAQDEQVFMYLYGAAGSGKGTLMNIAQNILGKGDDGYTAYVDSSMFVASRSTPHPTEFMQFLGVRMAVSSEVERDQKMATGKLKKVTGGDVISGRYMGKDHVTFDATHTLWIMANDRLQVPQDDKGVWRRLRVINFLHSKKAGEVIVGLEGIIVDQEGPGVLARWIEKAKEYLNEGYTTPKSVAVAGAAYVTAQDTVAEWIEYTVSTEDTNAYCAFEALRDAYVKWCKREGKTPVSGKKFSQDLQAKGFEAERKSIDTEIGRKQMRVMIGIQLLG